MKINYNKICLFLLLLINISCKLLRESPAPQQVDPNYGKSNPAGKSLSWDRMHNMSPCRTGIEQRPPCPNSKKRHFKMRFHNNKK